MWTFCVLVTLLVAGFCDASLLSDFGTRGWNGLRVTYGLNILDSRIFEKMPRREEEAIRNGFTKLSDCQTSTKFVGKRYWKDSDATIILIFDNNGYIAGIQTGIPNNLGNGYPSEFLRPNPYIADGDKYYLTAYFMDPANVCGGAFGAVRETGDNLYIQNGSDPISDSVLIPKLQSDIEETKWSRGKCFYGMGVHYFYNVDADTICSHIFPAFLLYNRGKLNAFGWNFIANIPNRRFEHPPKSSFKMFFEPVPRCLYEVGPITTMHIYLTNTPIFNLC